MDTNFMYKLKLITKAINFIKIELNYKKSIIDEVKNNKISIR
jgi:hypothetical protein